MQLGRLAFCRGRLDLAFDHDAATDRQLLDLVGIVRQLARRDDLQIAKATAVVELNEAEARLGIATGTNPAAHLDRLASGCSASLAFILKRAFGGGQCMSAED